MGFASVSDKKRRLALAKAEDEIEINTTTKWVPGLNNHRWGHLLVSHPSCLTAAFATHVYSASKVLLSRIVCKGVPSGSTRAPVIDAIDYGYAYHNKVLDDGHNQHITGRFMTHDGYPLGIYESMHDAGDLDYTAHSLLFGWNGAMYLVTETQGIYSQRMNGYFSNTQGENNHNAVVEIVGGHELICIQESQSGIWYVIGTTPHQRAAPAETETCIRDTVVPVEGPMPRTVAPISGGTVYYGLGYEPLGFGSNHTVYAWAMGTDKATTQQKVATALSADWRASLAACKAWWIDFFDGVREQWLYVPTKLRVKGYFALQQLAMNCYDNGVDDGWFLSSGAGNWYFNFIRDTAWVIKALSQVKPGFAKRLIDWYSNVAAPMHDHNAFGIDGQEFGSYYSTDNSATWLLGVGEYYAKTSDLATMQNHQTQLNSALEYAQDNYDAAGHHIRALHPHDFADDGYAPLPMSDIYYESMIDILWIAGMEAAAPIFDALGDMARATFCRTTAADLRTHLGDYREADGRLVHSLKQNMTKNDGAWWFPAYLYDAWLLGNEDSWAWCSKSKHVLGIRNSPIRYGLSIAQTPTDRVNIQSWGPFIGVVARLAAQHGDFEPANFVSTMFPGGSFAEFWYIWARDTGNVAQHYSHAYSFPWSYASILEMVVGLAQLR